VRCAAAVLLTAALGARADGIRPRRARARAAPATLSERLAAVVRRPPILPRSQFAVAVARVGEAAPVVAHNADASLILASTTKLFTTSAALDRLGTDYRFKTRLLRDGPVAADGTLEGHLVVAGGGDPAISGRLYDDDPLAVFRPWAQALVKQGVQRLRDGLLMDVSFFDDHRVHDDWPAEQEQYWWQAPTSALSYNDNVILVRATGGVRPGAPAILGFYPSWPPLLRLLGRVRTAQGFGASVGVRRLSGSRTVVAAGLVGRNRTWTGDVTVPDPPLYLASAFSRVLKDAAIDPGPGEPSVQTAPAAQPDGRRVLLYTHETPIVPVLSVCNKRSQSFYAEQILKTLGAEKHGLGTWGNGLVEVKQFLQSLGLPASHYQLADGSGRSRNNRASANDYLAFLQALATRWDKFPVFEPTLAISGDNAGSLRHRLLASLTRGKVYAKTGNIAGVVTLCGYVTAASGQKYAFAILINGGCPEGRGHSWQDRFLTELARFG